MSFDGIKPKNLLIGYHRPKDDPLIGGFFKKPEQAASAAVPAAPSAAGNQDAQRKRDEAEAAALAEQRAAGVRSTISGGAVNALAARQDGAKNDLLA